MENGNNNHKNTKEEPVETIPPEVAVEIQNKQYFDSYANLGIHEEMIKDKIRTEAYRKAIFSNPSDFKDKVVLDLGCGTAILSFFCAQAGAKKVYAIEASDIAEQAKLVIQSNHMEHTIILLKGRIEDVELPEKVDVIVSEWMGYLLLYESMLNSVIFARDNWLKPEGKLYPSEANMYLTPFCDDGFYETHVEFWRDVYGIDFSTLIPYAKKCAVSEPHVEYLLPQMQASFPTKFLTLDCTTITKDSLNQLYCDFSTNCIISGTIHGLACWFDVVFKGSNQTVTLTTSPDTGGTHWRQTLFYFLEPIPLLQDDSIQGKIIIKPNPGNNRLLDIDISVKTKMGAFNQHHQMK